MSQLLLDSQGVVVGLGGAESAELPPMLRALAPGLSLPDRLRSLSDLGHADAESCRHGLSAVLAGQLARFEHAIDDPGWLIVVESVRPARPVAAVCRLHRLPTAVAEVERLQAALDAAENRLEQVQSLGGLASWTFDVATRQAQWDAQMYRLVRREPSLGPYSAAELSRRCHADDLPGLVERRKRIYAGEPEVRSRFRLRCDDGVERWIESRVSLLGSIQPRQGMAVGTARDVTELVERQRRLEQRRVRLEELVVSRTVALAEAAERADAADRVRSAFLADASHELRTPLNVLISLAHLMQRDAGSDATMAARAGAVAQAARHLGAIVDDALAYARTDGRADARAAGTVPLRRLWPSQLPDEVAAMLAPAAQERGLRLEVAPHEPVLPVRGDAARLRQLLLEATRRALQAEPGSRVRLELTAAPPQRGRVTLGFAVVGPAIEPPAAGDADRLAALRRSIESLGGRLVTEAAADGGSRCMFEISLELAEGDMLPPVPADETLVRLRARHAGRRVLLAEDDEVNRIAMVELLGDAGLIVDTARDGREAVDLALRRDYALILLDLRMPRLDGLSAARAIRALPGLQAVPMVAISASAFDEGRSACLAAGMNDFLSKPIEVERLYLTVGGWLDVQHRAAGPGPDAPACGATGSPAAPAGSAEVAALTGLDGIDAVGGLATVGGREQAYRRLLCVFVDVHAADVRRFEGFIGAGDIEQATALVHRVRGAAATLGLVDVETAAAAFEDAVEKAAERGIDGVIDGGIDPEALARRWPSGSR